MKSKLSLLLAANLLLLSPAAMACGPFNPEIPRGDYIARYDYEPAPNTDRKENLLLWQRQTSADIPLADIEQVVYRDSRKTFHDRTNPDSAATAGNKMYAYLRTSDPEAVRFLELAKGVEEARFDEERNSPWYYPSSRDIYECHPDLDVYLQEALNYKGEKFRERYALQACRALFSMGKFKECSEYYDSIFADVADSSLMKRMSAAYAGGALIHSGDTARAIAPMVLAGDVDVLINYAKRNYMEKVFDAAPNAPEILDYLCNSAARDSARMARTLPLAFKALNHRDVTHKGDWAFYIAYFYNHFAHNRSQAANYMALAMQRPFSSKTVENSARAYKLKVDNTVNSPAAMLQALRWFMEEGDRYTMQNVVYADWIPRLWERGDYATAILLANYADSFGPYSREGEDYREEEVSPYDVDRGALAFQLMYSLNSDQLAAARKKMLASTPLNDFLRQGNFQDPNFFNELLGTLALREGNYARAVDYLLQVSIDYQRDMRVFRKGYLGANPFEYYPERWDRSDYDDWSYTYEKSAAPTPTRSVVNAKLFFARQMVDYQKRMHSASNADERGHARLMFALGRRNSFEQCWALTQYSRGFIEWQFIPRQTYAEDDPTAKKHKFLYAYDYDKAMKVEETFRREVNAAIASMTTDEARAEAHYLLQNLKTIAKRYPKTALAARLRTSCDNYSSWL